MKPDFTKPEKPAKTRCNFVLLDTVMAKIKRLAKKKKISQSLVIERSIEAVKE